MSTGPLESQAGLHHSIGFTALAVRDWAACATMTVEQACDVASALHDLQAGAHQSTAEHARWASC